MKRAALLSMLVVLLVLAMLMSPAAGQTVTVPEVTPEPTAEIMPSGFEWVMRSGQQCSLSPDETLLAVAGEGVYQLPDGSMQFAFEEKSGQQANHIYFTADSSQVIVNGNGVYDVASEQRVLTFDENSGVWVFPTSNYALVTTSGEEQWSQTLYDTATWEPAFPTFQYGPPERLAQGFGSADALMPATPGIYLYRDIVLTYDLNTLTANIYDFASQELLYTRTFDGLFTVDPTNTFLAVPGEDIRTLRTNEVVLDDLPVFTVTAQGRTRFSTDGQLALVERGNEAVVYSLPHGTELARLPLNLVWGDFELSEGGQSLVVSIRAESSENEEPAFTYAIDLSTGAIKGNERLVRLFYNSQLSPDGRYYAGHNAIYETDSGALVVSLDPSTGNGALFDRDGTLTVRAGDGVYDLVAKRKLFGLRNDSVEISPNGRFVWSRKVGVIDARTGELLYAMPGKSYYSFSSSSKYLMTAGFQPCNILALPEAQE